MLKNFHKYLHHFYISVIIGIVILSVVVLRTLSVKESVVTANKQPATLTPAQQLGEIFFFDGHMSNPFGKSCASCHSPASGFADPEKNAVSQGAFKTEFGNRNSLSIAYSAFTPYFHYDSVYYCTFLMTEAMNSLWSLPQG